MSRPASSPGIAARNGRRKPVARILFLLVGAVTVWHVFASFLWISPPSVVRELVPGTALDSYMIPWFGQSWSVFAPEPINGDYTLEVRAILHTAGGGESEPTEWVDATDAELGLARYTLFPPRAAGLATHQASLLFGTWDALDAEQQRIAGLNYYRGDAWLGRMSSDMKAQGDPKAVENYIVQERYTGAYATQVANTVWGEKNVKYVQFQVSRQNVIPFEKRHDPKAEAPAPQVKETGWRGTLVMPGQSQHDFDAVFGPLTREADK